MVPLDVCFQSMPRDEQVVWEIDAQVAELEELYDSVIGWHVMVFGPGADASVGNRYDVQITVALPCREIRVKRGRSPDANVYIAIENGFTELREQLAQWNNERLRMHADSRHGSPAHA